MCIKFKQKWLYQDNFLVDIIDINDFEYKDITKYFERKQQK